MKKSIGKCESCKEFISNILEINEYGQMIYGYGCMLGGNHLSEETFFNGCDKYKGIIHGND